VSFTAIGAKTLDEPGHPSHVLTDGYFASVMATGVAALLARIARVNPGLDRLSIGFPDSVLRKLPKDQIMDWVEADPARRAAIVAHLLKPVFASDSDVDALLVEAYGSRDDVRSAVFARAASGTFLGSAADHWAAIAEEMRLISERTALAGVRAWAQAASASFAEMAKHQRGREADQAIRWR